MKQKCLLLPLTVLMLCVVIIFSTTVAILGVVLGWWSLFGLESPEHKKAQLYREHGQSLREWQTAGKVEKTRFYEQLAAARDALPPKAPIDHDWEWTNAIAAMPAGYDSELVCALLDGYLRNPYDIRNADCQCAPNALDTLGQYGDHVTTLEQRFRAVADDPLALQVQFEAYLFENPVFDELEYALLHDIIDLGYWDPPPDDPADTGAQSSIGLQILIARATAYGLRGDQDSALDILFHLYDLAGRTRRSSLGRLQSSFAIAFRADRALSVLMPMIDWTPDRLAAVEQRMTSTPADLADTLRIAAANPLKELFDTQWPLREDRDFITMSRFLAADDLARAFNESPEAFGAALARADAESDADLPDRSVVSFMLWGMPEFSLTWHLRDVADSARMMAEARIRAPVFTLAHALEEFRTTHGAFPKSLGELADPETTLIDYRTGTPVAYVQDGDGYRLEAQGDEEPAVLWRVSTQPPCATNDVTAVAAPASPTGTPE